MAKRTRFTDGVLGAPRRSAVIVMTPTLVLMLDASRPGRTKPRLRAALGEAGAARVQRALVERQLRQVPDGWSVEVHFDPPGAEAELRAWLEPLAAGRPPVFNAQCDGDLGERLGHAMLNAFARRAEVVVFTDGFSPGLDAALLRDTGEALGAADLVVVPTENGGFAALGVRSHRLGIFNGIARGPDDVLVQALSRVKEAGLGCAVLGALRSVEDAADWERARAEFGLE